MDDTDPTKRSPKTSKPTEYERLKGERKAIVDAKREARRLKMSGSEEHPWVQSARERKASEGAASSSRSPADSRYTNRWIAWVAIAVIVAGGITTAGAALMTGGNTSSANPNTIQTVQIWHALNPKETSRMSEAVESLQSEDVQLLLALQSDLYRSLRAAIFQREPPDLAIVDMRTASELQASGLLIPLGGDDGTSYLPIAAKALWSRPLTIVAFRGQSAAQEVDLVRSLAQSLRNRLAALDEPRPEPLRQPRP